MTDEASSGSTASARVRRLHRLSGALLAAFVAGHLLSQASLLGGRARYEALAGALLGAPLAIAIEALLALAPLAVHLACGLYLLRRGGEGAERYGDRRAWVAQRIAAGLVLIFVAAHVWELRVPRLVAGATAAGLHDALAAHLSSTWAGIPWRALFYVLGIAAVAFHLANGLRASLAQTRLGAGPGAPRRLLVGTAVLGISLFLVGTATVVSLATGTRLLPGSDDDSGPLAPCGSLASPAPPPFPLPPPSAPSPGR